MIDVARVSAIDIHTHAEVSCCDPEDPVMGKFFDAASTYFKADRKRPTIPETIGRTSYRGVPSIRQTVGRRPFPAVFVKGPSHRFDGHTSLGGLKQPKDVVLDFTASSGHAEKLSAKSPND